MFQPAKTKRRSRGAIAQSVSRTAPILGWNARDPEAKMKEGYAIYLDNWWPSPTEVGIRKGALDHATGTGAPVKTLMAWQGTAAAGKLFGATDTGIFDCTAAGAVGAAVQTITNGKILSVNYAVTGGSYLFCVNGTDLLRHFNGTVWTTVAQFLVTGGPPHLDTVNIININVFKRQLFFIERASMSVYSLPVDSIGGTCIKTNLGGLFRKGGYVVAMGNWTVDGGDGIDDYAVFATSEGQLAVYRGTDPASAATWALVGVYDLSPPVGLSCFMKFGGELLFLNRDGLLPVSKVLQSVNIAKEEAISDLISNAFTTAAANYGSNYGWQIAYSFVDTLLLVNIPLTEFSTSHQYVMNTKNNAWARFTDWNAFCWAILGNQLYMGMNGKVAKAWFGLNDFGGNINCYGKSAYSYLGTRGRSKKINLMRPVLRISGTVAVDVAVDMDFEQGTAFGPSVFSSGGGSLWGTALWGTGIWASSAAVKLDWVTVAVKEGYAAAPRLRVAAKDATVSWFSTDLAFEQGAIQG